MSEYDLGPARTRPAPAARGKDRQAPPAYLRQAGNAAVARRLARPVQRVVTATTEDQAPAAKADTQDAGGDASALPPAAQALVGQDFTVPLTPPPPTQLPPEAMGPGDYVTPGENGTSADPTTVMALRDTSLPSPLQRDDAPAGVDAQAQSGATVTPKQGQGAGAVPSSTVWQGTLQGTFVFRSVNLLGSAAAGKVEFLHEPQVTFNATKDYSDRFGSASAQASIAFINLHVMPPWGQDVELSLGGFIQEQILPKYNFSYGGQVQGEFHIGPVFSAVASIPVSRDQDGVVTFGPTVGALLHIDKFLWNKDSK